MWQQAGPLAPLAFKIGLVVILQAMGVMMPKSLAKNAVSLLIALCACLPSLADEGFDDFSKAKQAMPGIFKQLKDPRTLYCGCPLTFERNRYYPDLKACGYEVRRNARRAARIEAEHMMPAWDFGHAMQCWQDGGRKKCEIESPDFRRAEGDLHNLYPSVGEVNGDRSNFRYTQGSGEPMYGKCEVHVNFKERSVEIPERARGIAARAMLYMSETYKVALSKRQRKLYEAWDEIYPPDADECLWNSLVKKRQGTDNKFVSAKCQAK